MEQIETLTKSGYRLIQDDEHFKLGIDSILLSAFCRMKRNINICDLGCGSGVISLLLAGEEETARIDGIDILPSAVSLTNRSIELNGLNNRVSAIQGDIVDIKKFLPASSYDLAVSNPPYFKLGSGEQSKNENKRPARTEAALTVNELCSAAAYILKWGGSFCVIYRTDRLVDMICAMRENGMEPKRLRLISHTHNSAPSSFMLEARRGGGVGLVTMPALIISNSRGSESDEVKEIYGKGEL